MSQNIGYFVVNSYVTAEDSLIDILRIIPYCPKHKSVWSPSLVTILLETCNQLDSLWKFTAKQSRCVTKRERDLKITDYFQYFGEYVAPRWVIFWGEEPIQISPFEKWRKSPPFTKDKYEKLPWWEAYNDIKHNRLKNKTVATLEVAVTAMAVLYVTILWYKYCRDAVAHSSWFSPLESNPRASLAEDSPSTKYRYFVA